MRFKPSTLERAFELARSGRCLSITDLRQALKLEGFHDGRMHTDGPSIQRQLSALMALATGRPLPAHRGVRGRRPGGKPAGASNPSVVAGLGRGLSG